jgi:hypothetical protein
MSDESGGGNEAAACPTVEWPWGAVLHTSFVVRHVREKSGAWTHPLCIGPKELLVIKKEAGKKELAKIVKVR